MTEKEQKEELQQIAYNILKYTTDVAYIPDLSKPIAEFIYSNYYRKIDNKDYFDKKGHPQYFKTAVEDCAKIIVKETVKDIVWFITNNCHIEYDDMTNIMTFIKERFGVEIEYDK